MIQQQLIKTIAVVLCIMVFASGCEPLRKKFTRKKKGTPTEDVGMIPVLEPQEYPTPDENPTLNYQQHYAMVKVFYKDLGLMVTDQRSAKNAQYVLDRVEEHLVQMKATLKQDKRGLVDQLTGYLSSYREAVNVQPHLRNRTKIEADLRRFHRVFIKECKPNQLKGSFVDAVPYETAH